MNRTRTDPAVISYALYLYFSCLSFRLAAKCLESIVKRSHVAIWNGVQKNSFIADRFQINKRIVKEIFVDESLIKIDGQKYWLWIAYEPNLEVCLSMHLSRERTIFVCYWFFKQLRNRYCGKTIYIDGADWYGQACKWLRLPHQVYGVELKNLMEHFIQQIKDRIECFDDHFPCRKEDCDRQHVWNWLKLFLPYLHLSIDRIRFMTFFFLATDGG